MRLLVDCRAVRFPRHDGISRYTAEMVAALAKLTPLTMLIEDDRQLAMLPDLPFRRIPSKTSVLDPFVALVMNRLGADIVFSPMQTMGSLGRRYRLVLTVHDLIYYAHRTPPRDLPWFVRALWRLYHLSWWPQRLLLSRADGVAVVSRTTGRLVLDNRLTVKPLIVAPNGVHPPEAPPLPRTQRTRDLVYMGSFMPYKNVETLVRAMNELPDYTLQLMSRVTDAARQRLTDLSVHGNLVFHDGASDEDYSETLAGATALVSCSLDEGFGIPLVEAMAVGTPVVVSDIGIFHEIAAEAGRYVNPRDASAVASAVRALEDDDQWQRMSDAGVTQAARWNWDASAAELLAGLERVLAR